jgi:uncharacterized tellurite resistance protein B-like protein
MYKEKHAEFTSSNYIYNSDILLAIANLSLIALISDGKALRIEFETFRNRIEKYFKLDRSDSSKLAEISSRCIKICDHNILINSACFTLKDSLQKNELLLVGELIYEIVVADGDFCKIEQIYLDRIARELEIDDLLSQKYLLKREIPL